MSPGFLTVFNPDLVTAIERVELMLGDLPVKVFRVIRSERKEEVRSEAICH